MDDEKAKIRFAGDDRPVKLPRPPRVVKKEPQSAQELEALLIRELTANAKELSRLNREKSIFLTRLRRLRLARERDH